VNTTSGFFTSLSAWRRSTWKYCAGVLGTTICQLCSAESCRNRSMRACCARAPPLVPMGEQLHRAALLATSWPRRRR
jgi:hypothetical protein